ncbi:MAG: pyroglutamyl-peptidase I [Candidatus Heimdallarchaeota archaeon]|nr:pyroglutamyl-peptidase I [Candidatus Heimdallarchaeota archaeon]
MKKVIITGFEPFGGELINPALEVMKALTQESIPNVNLIPLQLPVVFRKAYKILIDAIENEKPDLVLSIGQAGGRSTICLERLGINLQDARIADNEGNTPKDEKIDESGPAAYFTTIDIRKTELAIRAVNIPVLVSNSAGLYVCNDIIYGTLHFLVSRKSSTKYGFIHVPFLPEQVAPKSKDVASMELVMIKEAIRIAIITNL